MGSIWDPSGQPAYGLTQMGPMRNLYMFMGSYGLNVINCYLSRGMYNIGFPALYNQSDYLDKLETHQVTCRGQLKFGFLYWVV